MEKRIFLTNDVLAFLLNLTARIYGGRLGALIRFYYGYSSEEIASMNKTERMIVVKECKERIFEQLPALKNMDTNKAKEVVYRSKGDCSSKVFADLKSHLIKEHNLSDDYFQHSVELVR